MKLMFKGKTHTALQILSIRGRGGILSFEGAADKTPSSGVTVRDTLKRKHPVDKPTCLDSVVQGSTPDSHPVIFESFDATAILSVSLCTSGAAGPSSLDTLAERGLCTAFQRASVNLCKALASCATCPACVLVELESISPLLACSLSP